MSWKSTMGITRADAQAKLIEYILKASDEELESLLHPLGESSESGVYGHNFRIVSNYVKQDKCGDPCQFGHSDSDEE